jgi:hypothetical protein
MQETATKRSPSGYVSYLLVLAMGSVLMVLMVFAYRRALASQTIESDVQLQVDYGEKEEAILRAIVAITPNRAIRAMQHLSNASLANRNPLSWESIFTEALGLANARGSISDPVLTSLGTPQPMVANSGDSSLGDVSLIFKALGEDTGYVSAGINRPLVSGYPAPLSCNDTLDSARDPTYPILSNSKLYGDPARGSVALSVDTYPHFNIINYPNINFGYARPGQPFVARRNWWGFSVDLAEHDTSQTAAVRSRRDFVLSVYEIPSQLAISASSFMALGQHASGGAWDNVTVTGGIFAGRAVVEGNTALETLATRRGAVLSGNTTVGGQSFNGDPLAPGVREAYQLTQGDFFPVSLASESGRAAFIPINRGADYFDRFAHAPETDTLSSTTWNNYSIGALQCAMRLDIADVASATNMMPTKLRFSYLKGGGRLELPLPLTAQGGTGPPQGYLFACNQTETYDFGTAVVDVAFGVNGAYAYKMGVTGMISFDVPTFGDPVPEVVKFGYFRPSYPFEVKTLPSGKICIAVYPKRFAAFLSALRADSTAVNHSLVVNVDYTVATGTALLTKPSIPCTDLDYGVILQECDDLTSFTKGFSLVTNLRLYIGDDFNVVATPPPADYTPVGQFFPPCSVFSPEKRYGVELDPYQLKITGQVGSLASESATAPIHPADAKVLSGETLDASRIQVNLRPITHPSELPPISMMNWLVLLEERKREY